MPVAPPSLSSYRSSAGLSTAVVVMLCVHVCVDLFALWSGFRMYEVATRLDAASASASASEVDGTGTVYTVVGMAQLYLLLATAVVFVIWLHRVRVNAELFAPEYHAKKRAWVVWSWIVPVVNLWFPRRIALDIWEASTVGSRRISAALINWWWAAWLLSFLVSRYGRTPYLEVMTLGEMRFSLAVIMATDALDLVAAALAVLWVRRLVRMQEDKVRRLAEQEPVPGAV
ncbi:DUF4328 domain-containing protein [Streptomyces monticola]|uniref:DUF4328 domain-containing protein n=1 Tax=Streptomyces monticola TaxID=2666263 RepID=A0ABW2JMG0_9ACTN